MEKTKDELQKEHEQLWVLWRTAMKHIFQSQINRFTARVRRASLR